MKQIILILIAAITLGMASCSKDIEPPVTQNQFYVYAWGINIFTWKTEYINIEGDSIIDEGKYILGETIDDEYTINGAKPLTYKDVDFKKGIKFTALNERWVPGYTSPTGWVNGYMGYKALDFSFKINNEKEYYFKDYKIEFFYIN